MVKKIIFIILIIICLCACSRNDNKNLTFAVGGAPREIEFWEQLLKEFEQQERIKIDILRQPTDTDQRRQGLAIPLRSEKKDPDIFLMDVAWIAQFAASGWLEDLTWYTKINKSDLDVFFAKVLTLADRYQEKLIALPVYVDGGLLYYRKDLLEKYGYAQPPQYWQELVEIALNIQEQERKVNPNFYGFVWQGAQYEGLICNFLEFSASAGGGFLFKEGKILLNISENIKALRYMYELIHKFKISPPNTFTDMKEEEVRNFFQQGNALFERNWPYAWALHQGQESYVKDRVGIAPLPHFIFNKSVSTLGGWHIGISKYSDNKDESFKFIQFVTSYNIQKRLSLELGWNPARKDIYSDKQILENVPHFIHLREVFQNAYPRPNVPYYTLISEAMQRHISGILSGRIDLQDALASAEQEVQEIINLYEKE